MPEQRQQSRWKDHLEQAILPWWERGVDEQAGGVFTCFDNSGSLLSKEKYTWSQGRWAWMSAELAGEAEAGRLDLDAERWAERARRTARFLVDHAVLDDHSTAYRIDETGRPMPNPPSGRIATSVFADLFVVLGLAGAIRYAGDPAEADRWESIALDILDAAEMAIGNRTAPTDPYPVPAGFTDLAGPMNLLHASSELLRARHSDRAAGVRDRARAALVGGPGVEGFLHPEWWWEFRPGSADQIETLLARHRTPGHLLELVWMLIHSDTERVDRGEADAPVVPREQLNRLAGRALELGWDTEYGGILRYSDHRGGAPTGPYLQAEPAPYERLVGSTWDTKLWWVHAEALYAAALLTDLGSSAMAAQAERIEDYTLQTFPDHDHGEWLQIRSRDGSPLEQVVALPVKDPMHIARSLILLNRLEATSPKNGHR
ncbi:MAG TPA: AGE family epimerase/isomerase [Microlunatus sp.]